MNLSYLNRHDSFIDVTQIEVKPIKIRQMAMLGPLVTVGALNVIDKYTD